MYKAAFHNEKVWTEWSHKRQGQVDYFWVAKPHKFPAILMYCYEQDSLFRHYLAGYFIYESDFADLTESHPVKYFGVPVS